MKNISKYLQRLKHASAGEVVYRLRQVVENRYYSWKISNDRFQLNIPVIKREHIDRLELPIFEGEDTEDAVREILKGEIFSLNADQTDIKSFEDRYRNMFTSFVGTNSNSPDIRAVWEPARLQHITILLLYLIRNPENEPVKEYAKTNVLRWIDENPFLVGPHYMSAMECGLRIPVFFYALKIIDNLLESDQGKILNTIYEHTWWIFKRLSLYTSLGNHTICEGIGLIFGGSIFSQTDDGKKWLDHGIVLLDQELVHQVLSDGGPCEQSINYHRFVLDFYWLALDFLEGNSLFDCSGWFHLLEKGEAYLKTFTDSNGNYPKLGDSDDGYAIAPGVSPIRRSVNIAVEKVSVFKKAGYTVIRNNGIHLTFDHGPLGMAPLFNHGHADALSVTLSKNGSPILIDPGTYRYNGAPSWRKYFKGTRAHNTISIDNADQAVQATGFIWTYPYECSLDDLQENIDKFFIKATHDGYSRLEKGLLHHRSIKYQPSYGFFIEDTFFGKKNHYFELNYHLHPLVNILKDGDWWQLAHGEERIFMQLIAPVDFTPVKGSLDPILGWYSPEYGLKEETTVLQAKLESVPSEVKFKTLVVFEKQQAIGFR